MAPKIIWKLEDKVFMEAFKDKSQLSELLAHILVNDITNDQAALLGAANVAMKLLETS